MFVHGMASVSHFRVYFQRIAAPTPSRAWRWRQARPIKTRTGLAYLLFYSKKQHFQKWCASALATQEQATGSVLPEQSHDMPTSIQEAKMLAIEDLLRYRNE
jgi:hypothetical protein